jgi:hypothetical protein
MLQKNGLQGVFINGSSGEGYMLTEEERMKLAERWVSVAPAGFKVIVHVGSCCVKASRMLAEHAQKIGATAIGIYGIGSHTSYPYIHKLLLHTDTVLQAYTLIECLEREVFDERYAVYLYIIDLCTVLVMNPIPSTEELFKKLDHTALKHSCP